MGISPVATGGFGNWKKVEGIGWGLGKALGTEVALGCIFDSDYRPGDELENILATLGKFLCFAKFLGRKEIENYMLIPSVLRKAAQRAVVDRVRRGLGEPRDVPDLSPLLFALTDPLESEVFGQYIGQATRYRRTSGIDAADTATSVHAELRARWSILEGRLILCPGKQVLASLRQHMETEYGVTLTPSRILTAMSRDDVPEDLALLISGLDEFRKAGALVRNTNG